MFFLIPILINIVIGIALQAIGYLMLPKPKSEKGAEVTDMDNPTAEGGRPIPVVFGEKEVTGVNILWYGDKETTSREIDA
ncbi:hypothetical protein BPNPMPFG_002518 [Mesorhizobium sp. AR07]|uniref:hypothetical protein n=1 Tax=Mesorhizobium sp. AR07 TaxID=2865838 RepID=UPI00215F7F1E|nr:hypothetical protein [Mesorhizobium sp. AR07]UVK46808.1 hypothetical protein BPNPMPFG_002518 [Mesorhizobium sp. AR07]